MAGHVRAEDEHGGAGRRDVVGRDLVAELEQHRRLQRLGAPARPSGTGLMFGPCAPTLAARPSRRRRSRPPRPRTSPGSVTPGAAPERARIGDDAGQRRGRRHHRRAEIDLVALHAAAPGEVAVERAQALGAGGRHVADARARAAGRLGHRGAGGEQVGEQPLARHRLEDAVAAREDHERDRRMHLPAAHDADHRRTCRATSRWCRSRPSPARSRVPATSLTGTTRSGEPGSATSGTSALRSSSIWSSYVASASARQRPPVVARGPRRARNERVTSSEGKTLVVSASSAPMLAMVMRCAASEARQRPGPPYSKILPLPPRTVSAAAARGSRPWR